MACKLICNGEKSNNFWPAPTAKKAQTVLSVCAFFDYQNLCRLWTGQGNAPSPGASLLHQAPVQGCDLRFVGVPGITGAAGVRIGGGGEEGHILFLQDALEAGASDFSSDGDVLEITTEPEDFSAVREDLEAKGYAFVSAEVEMLPDVYSSIEDPESVLKMEKLLDVLEDNDDVQNVYHNWEQD